MLLAGPVKKLLAWNVPKSWLLLLLRLVTRSFLPSSCRWLFCSIHLCVNILPSPTHVRTAVRLNLSLPARRPLATDRLPFYAQLLASISTSYLSPLSSLAMGQKPTEEELFQMISEVDDNMSGSIDFGEFLKVIETQKERAAQFDDESDLIDAYVACGGEPDKSGHVDAEVLIKIIKHDFGLTIDIEELIKAIDTDGSGEIEFEEFKELLT